MALFRKNIGGVQQMFRIVAGAGLAVAAIFLVDGPYKYLGVAVGLSFAATGLVGYCPACAMAGIGPKA